MRFRLGLVYLFFVFFLLLISARLVQLQILENDPLRKYAERQFRSNQHQTAFRLPILDRNGKELAVNMRATSVFAHPKQLRNVASAARRLARLLGKTPEYWKKKLRSKKSFIWIARQIDNETGRKLEAADIPGIFVKPENTRVYPNGPLAAAVIGFTDIDGKGLAGVELGQNEELVQPDSPYPILRDGKGKVSYIANLDRDYPAESAVSLTIDRTLQYMVEEECRRTLEETGARGVLALAMDPFTGEILAMSQLPGFDPNQANVFPGHLFVNRFVSHRFEPGSTLKALFAAQALEMKLLSSQSRVDTHGGALKIGGKTFREHDAKHKYDSLSVEEVIRYSSNIGAIEIARKLGVPGVIQTLHNFGLTEKTRVGLPGEVSGYLRPAKQWTPLVLANAGFGQGVAFTPLQMITAFAPFANGGYLVRPKILRSEVTAVTKENLDLRRVLSPETAEKMKEILVSVTEHPKGTAANARVKGTRVAGKTGTAQKYHAGEGYKSGKYYSSFIGFLPAEHPQLLLGVIVDEPAGKEYYAAQVAAPLFQRIATKSMHLLGAVPRQTATSRPLVVQTSRLKEAPKRLTEHAKGVWIMPDIRGATIKEALDLFAATDGRLAIEGHGYLFKQSPEPGAKIRAGSSIHLKFSPI